MDAEKTKKDVTEAMNNAVSHMMQEFAGVRTGKASPALVENLDVKVVSYGSNMRLKELDDHDPALRSQCGRRH